jgi:hypothetical protein
MQPPPQKDSRKPLPPSVVEGHDFSEMATRVYRISDCHSLTVVEKDNLWRLACETFAEQTRAGREASAVKRVLSAWLCKYVPDMGATETAIVRNFERKLSRFNTGQTVADLRKQAAKERRAPKLSQADRDTLSACAVFKHEGDLDPAWFHCIAGGKLAAEIITRYPLAKNKRIRCPRAIRRQVSKEISRLLAFHRSERQAKLNGPYLQREWEGVFAGDWFSSDDITLPVYYYVPDGNGWFELTRGQFLPLIDVRSKRILDFVLIDGKSYNAAAIRSLINKTCTRFGLPRKGFHFERGIWADAKLLGGGTALPSDEMEQTFADRLGIRIMHSLPGNARAKIVENVANLFQNLLAGESGYVGRNEIVIKHDRVQKAKREVESRRQHPAAVGFLSAQEWFSRLHVLCPEYNAKPQESKVFGGYMSPDDAWERLQLRNSAGAVVGLTKLPDELRYMLASQRVPVTVRRGRVRVPFSKFQYCVAGSNIYNGENLLAWYDPESTETLCITDYKMEQVFCLPRETLAPAYDATPEEFEQASAAMREQNRNERARYSELAAKYLPPARVNITDATALEIGRKMAVTRNRIKSHPNTAVEFGRPTRQTVELSRADRARRMAELNEFEKAHKNLFE